MSLVTKLLGFLFKYKSTPQSMIGVPLTELMFGRPLKLHLDLMHPSIQSNVIHRQEQQQCGHDQRVKERDFKPGDPVYICNFAQGVTWLPGAIVEVCGSVSNTVVQQLELTTITVCTKTPRSPYVCLKITYGR